MRGNYSEPDFGAILVEYEGPDKTQYQHFSGHSISTGWIVGYQDGTVQMKIPRNRIYQIEVTDE